MADKLHLLAAALLAVAVALLAYMAFMRPPQSVDCTVPSDLKVTYAQPAPEDKRLEGSYWACNGLVCSRYMTPEEWAGKYCYVQDAAMVCILRTQQGQIIVPAGQLNLSAVRECAEYRCMQEVLVRNASYMIPVT